MNRLCPGSSIDQTQLPQTREARTWVIMGVALLIIVTVSLVLAYLYHPSFQQMMDQSFKMTQLPAQQALLYFTVPVLGAALLIGMALYIRSKHHERLEVFTISGEEFAVVEEQVDQSIKATLQEMRPTKRQLAITAMVLGTLTILGFIGFAVCKWLPAGNNWWHQVAEPTFNHPFAMWEALAYFGGIPAGVAVIAGLAIAAIHNHRLRTEGEKAYHIYNESLED